MDRKNFKEIGDGPRIRALTPPYLLRRHIVLVPVLTLFPSPIRVRVRVLVLVRVRVLILDAIFLTVLVFILTHRPIPIVDTFSMLSRGDAVGAVLPMDNSELQVENHYGVSREPLVSPKACGTLNLANSGPSVTMRKASLSRDGPQGMRRCAQLTKGV
ncbi:unnamed protein product [Parascedosporium putredinis]|uniref:Uncharacterized protein n=1 Tax=Parascedosporium putredinis TaxID=1442378 RepID=A0A9P1GW47_9PEZI|nr:unnamed protein product [Parascedosporium putredinis]CAI7988483.1 unnamed protein product [Parascedosporium putredinis]